jgi:dihydrofolate reductase
MRKIVANEYVTLDGVTEDPGPTEDFDRVADDFEHAGWTLPYWNDELAELQSEQLFASEALLLGRVTYEEFVASWPKRSGDPYTERINSMPKFIASTTLKEPLEWNASLLEGDTAEAVTKLKKQPGKDLLLYGSGALVHSLMQHGLIDTLRLILYPLALPGGKRLFRDRGHTTKLSLTDATTTDTGVAVLTYERAESA